MLLFFLILTPLILTLTPLLGPVPLIYLNSGLMVPEVTNTATLIDYLINLMNWQLFLNQTHLPTFELHFLFFLRIFKVLLIELI